MYLCSKLTVQFIYKIDIIVNLVCVVHLADGRFSIVVVLIFAFLVIS